MFYLQAALDDSSKPGIYSYESWCSMECPRPWVPHAATITKPLAGDFQQCLWTMSLTIKLTKTLCENGCWMTGSGMFMPMKP